MTTLIHEESGMPGHKYPGHVETVTASKTCARSTIGQWLVLLASGLFIGACYAYAF